MDSDGTLLQRLGWAHDIHALGDIPERPIRSDLEILPLTELKRKNVSYHFSRMSLQGGRRHLLGTAPDKQQSETGLQTGS